MASMQFSVTESSNEFIDNALYNDANIVDYWRFTSGSLTGVKTGYVLTDLGVPLTTFDGKFGNSVGNGSATCIAYLTTAMGMNGLTDSTMAGWFWTDRNDSNNTRYFFAKTTVSNSRDFFVHLSNKSTITISNGGTSTTYTYKFPVNEWVHICGVKDVTNNALKLFINGILVASTTIGTTAGSGSDFFAVGCDFSSASNWGSSGAYNGTIDEMVLFSRALSNSEVLSMADQNKIIFNQGSTTREFINNSLYNDANCVEYWQFSSGSLVGTKASNTLSAVSGTATSGTGKYGNCIQSSSGDLILVRSNALGITGVTDMSMSGWFKASLPPLARYFFSHSASSTARDFEVFVNADNKAVISNGGTSVISNYKFPVNEWVHVCGVRDNTNNALKLFINGVLVASTTIGTTAGAGSNAVIVGANALGVGGAFPSTSATGGQIDDVVLFSRALTNLEVQTLAEANTITF